MGGGLGRLSLGKNPGLVPMSKNQRWRTGVFAGNRLHIQQVLFDGMSTALEYRKLFVPKIVSPYRNIRSGGARREMHVSVAEAAIF